MRIIVVHTITPFRAKEKAYSAKGIRLGCKMVCRVNQMRLSHRGEYPRSRRNTRSKQHQTFPTQKAPRIKVGLWELVLLVGTRHVRSTPR